MSKIVIRLVMLLAVLLTSQTASAAIEPNGVLDEVAVRFMTASATWGTVITNYAAWLFWTLGTISVWRWYSPDSCPQKGVVIRLQTG
ncbi:hypothetical protein ACET7I_14320 [Aeromonas caviae]